MRALAVLLLLLAGSVAADEDRHVFITGVDTSLVQTSTPLTSWTEGGVGKLRYDEDHDGLRLSRAFFDYRGRLTSTLNVRATLNYNPDIDGELDFTEAYLEFRPVPRSDWRWRAKLGAFYPQISMENVDVAWSTPYTLSSSTINSWIAEELRTIGLEWSVQRDGFAPGSPHHFGAEAAIFFANDPTGAYVAWKGWSVHDRQTGLRGKLPLPPLPLIQPGGPAPTQDPHVEPFREIDHKAGFYVGGNYRYRERFRINMLHYDNHADPEAESGGQYAWATWFNHLGVQFALPGDIGLIGQWVDGRTQMGPDVGPTRLIDAYFDAWSTLATKALGRHRVSLRYDDFNLGQYDTTWFDNQLEHGDAWTVAWLYQHSPALRFGLEYVQIYTDRLAWMYYPDSEAATCGPGGIEPCDMTEKQLQLTLRWLFSNQSL